VNQTGELRRQIEDMALQLIVGEPENSAQASAWLPLLEKISATAAREHVEPVVSAVAALGETLRALSASGDPSVVSSVLQEGVAKLQQALESPVPKIDSQEMSLAQDPELMSDFIVESREHLVNIESQVLTLEREPSDNEALNAVFRGFHTI
jgi:two-component system chemotaxis sensor kinase CheA